MIAVGKVEFAEEECWTPEHKELQEFWSEVPEENRQIYMDFLSLVLRRGVAKEFVDAWLQCWDFGVIPGAFPVPPNSGNFSRQGTASCCDLGRPVIADRKSSPLSTYDYDDDPRFTQVLSEAVVESVKCQVFVDVLADAIYKKTSKIATLLVNVSSDHSQVVDQKVESELRKWSLPTCEEWDPNFLAGLRATNREPPKEQPKSCSWFSRALSFFGWLLLGKK